MKYFILPASILLSFLVGLSVAYAQGYVPLAPLPGIDISASTQASNLIPVYVSGAIKLIIALGAAMAVLFAIIGGTQYVAASINPVAKKDALERVQNALIGLGIILSSYMVLNSINPKLVDFNINLSPVTTKKLVLTTAPTPISTATFREEGAVRDTLTRDSKIIINRDACTEVGQKLCTNVANLNGKAIIGLRALDAKTCSRKNAIGLLANNCNVVITGATEYWEHETHGDGSVETSTKVDLRKGSPDGIVDNYIIQKGVIPETPCGLRNAPKYQPDGPMGGTYVDEGNHWHVCY